MKSISSVSEFPIYYIDTEKALKEMVERLSRSEIIAFDTEYDSFKRSYGFTLLLLQFFDGKEVFILDPLRVKNIEGLWPVMENSNILKLVYAGSEDIALLKALGCQTKNVCDIQIAATLANHPARNLRDLLDAGLGVQIDKDQQTSDWSKRPLSERQLAYAANDVVYLPQLLDMLLPVVRERELLHVLDEDNACLEEVTEREHIPKLKPSYYREYPQAYCNALLAMMEVRDKIAQQMNLPPVHIVDNRFLEEALQRKDEFLRMKAFKGFHPRVKANTGMTDSFIQIIEKYDPEDKSLTPRERSTEPRNKPLSKSEKEKLIQEKYEPVKTAFVAQYGELTALYLLRGLKKELVLTNESSKELRNYQRHYLQLMQ